MTVATGPASAWLALRSLLWAVLLPGTVAGYVPWRFFGLRSVRPDAGNLLDLAGLATMVIGALLLAICIWEFAHRGRGTLAPVDPPRELVVRGLYCYVRNPMYLSVTAILLGELLLVRSMPLAGYAFVWLVATNLFVLGYEEPALRRRFGPSYHEYARRVRRWIPTRPGTGGR
jgi:protein-S-isoprenylcysteine O-methyltransferase Ste14